MTTIHLSDAQRDTFTACGLIVIDGEQWEYQDERNVWRKGALVAPEGWRILTEPCDTCDGDGKWEECRPVDGWVDVPCTNPDCVGGRRVVTLTAKSRDYTIGGEYVTVTLGRFTIPALLPVVDEDYGAVGYVWPDHDALFVDNSDPEDRHAFIYTVADGMTESVRLDPLPRPGQFIAMPERVA